jgi:hypothetical protein
VSWSGACAPRSSTTRSSTGFLMNWHMKPIYHPWFQWTSRSKVDIRIFNHKSAAFLIYYPNRRCKIVQRGAQLVMLRPGTCHLAASSWPSWGLKLQVIQRYKQNFITARTKTWVENIYAV